jgi:hypothetical protein
VPDEDAFEELEAAEETEELVELEEVDVAAEVPLEEESPAGTPEVVLLEEGRAEVAPSLLLLLEEKLGVPQDTKAKVRTPKSRVNGLRNEKAFMGGVSCRNYFKPAFYHKVMKPSSSTKNGKRIEMERQNDDFYEARQ